MRYSFRVRHLQRHPSHFDALGGVVVDASEKFAWLIGKSEEQALQWVERKALGPRPPWKARPNTSEEIAVLGQVYLYAKELSVDKRMGM